MEIVSWSTADVEPRRRFEYWNDLVSKAVRGGMHVVQPRLRLNSHPINAVGYSISRRGLGLSLAPV